MRPYRGTTKDGKVVKGWYCHTHLRYYCDGTEQEEKHFIINDSLSEYMLDRNEGEDYIYDISEAWEVIPESVSQSTGLTDKNDEEIYGSIWIDGKLTEGGDEITFIPIDGSTEKRQQAIVYYDSKRVSFCAKSQAWNCRLSFCKDIEIIHDKEKP